jgi:hypothetical protein
MTLAKWLRENPPDDMPFFPGARVTGEFGLRQSKMVLEMGASPLHLGVDRAGGDGLRMPFDGYIYWRQVGGVAGSVLSIMPDECKLELQVFHTIHVDKHVMHYEDHFFAGEHIPIEPSNIGLSQGVHTHTELLMPFDSTVAQRFAGDRLIVDRGVVDVDYVHDQYVEMGFDEGDIDRFTVRAIGQVRSWAISDVGAHHAIRKHLPSYRRPQWGAGPTLHIDTMYLLQI